MKTVLLDTNFLIDLGRFGVSIDEIDKVMNERYEPAVLRSTLNELKSIAATQQEESKFAKVALMLLDLRGVAVIESEKIADEGIVEAAEKDKQNIIVATDDIELRKRLKSLGIKTIYLRGKKQLSMS